MDGEPSFRSARTKAVLRTMCIRKFWFPPRSGDLLPMETFWANTMQALTKKVAASRRWAMGVKVNKTNLKAWEGMVIRTIKKRSPLFIRRLISGMKTRVEALVKNKGGPIRW
jgi:hypothetical protein